VTAAANRAKPSATSRSRSKRDRAGEGRDSPPKDSASDIDDRRLQQGDYLDEASTGRKTRGKRARPGSAACLALCAAFALCVAASTAEAQLSPSGPPPDGPAPKSALRPGANSFTESQARDRLETLGYERVGRLRKDGDGIWRGTAEHGGRAVEIGLDYRGAVVRSETRE